MSVGEYRYRAFISYRHVSGDRKWAQWLVERLEAFRTPARMIKAGMPQRVGRLFRDDDEIPASHDLSNQIEDALRDSEYLIVICSSHTPQSKWVSREVAFFRELGRGDRIIPFLTEGEPAASFPPELLEIWKPGSGGEGGAADVLADVRAAGERSSRAVKREAFLQIAAALLKADRGELAELDGRRRVIRRAALGALAGAAAVAVIASLYVGQYVDRSNADYVITNAILTRPSKVEDAWTRRAEALYRGYSPDDLHTLAIYCRGQKVEIANASDREVQLNIGLDATDEDAEFATVKPGQTSHLATDMDYGLWLIYRDLSDPDIKKGYAHDLFALGVVDCTDGTGAKQIKAAIPDDLRPAADVEKLAAAGDAKAQLELGDRYAAGLGVPIDFARALQWYRKASVQGSVPAQLNLASFYLGGIGTLRGDQTAIHWYEKAASAGSKLAMRVLAEIYSGRDYFNPGSSISDLSKAAIWYRKLARTGDPLGQFEIGTMYKTGHGVGRDYAEAMKWYKRAAAQNFAAAELAIGKMYWDGIGVPLDKAQSGKWMQRASDHGAVGATANLGYQYATGQGVTKDYKRAIALLQTAANKDNATALDLLASMYAGGIGVPKNVKKARDLYEKSAERNDAEGAYRYGMMCLNGEGGPVKKDEGVNWLQLAVAKGSKDAAAELHRLGQ